MNVPAFTALRELYAADRAARTAAHPPRSGSCRYCGYLWIPYAGTRLDGHTQCCNPWIWAITFPEGAMIQPIYFTRHACERYREFHMLDRPAATDDDARAILEQHADGATKSGRTFRGDPLWSIAALGVELVAKHEDGLNVCVTVLPPPRFRGLTPLQVERVTESVARRDTDLAQRTADRDAVAAAPVKARRERDDRLSTLRGQVAIANLEREILCGALKTMRHQLSAEANESAQRKALGVAVRYLLASRDPAAHDALEEIRVHLPGYAARED